MCGQAVVDVSVGVESASGVAEHPLGLRRLCSDSVRIEVQILSMQFMRARGL